MAINTNIAALPGARVFSYYFWSANRCACNFFLKHLRVEASHISTGTSEVNRKLKKKWEEPAWWLVIFQANFRFQNINA